MDHLMISFLLLLFCFVIRTLLILTKINKRTAFLFRRYKMYFKLNLVRH
jgi:hypothetical protein